MGIHEPISVAVWLSIDPRNLLVVTTSEGSSYPHLMVTNQLNLFLPTSLAKEVDTRPHSWYYTPIEVTTALHDIVPSFSACNIVCRALYLSY